MEPYVPCVPYVPYLPYASYVLHHTYDTYHTCCTYHADHTYHTQGWPPARERRGPFGCCATRLAPPFSPARLHLLLAGSRLLARSPVGSAPLARPFRRTLAALGPSVDTRLGPRIADKRRQIFWEAGKLKRLLPVAGPSNFAGECKGQKGNIRGGREP